MIVGEVTRTPTSYSMILSIDSKQKLYGQRLSIAICPGLGLITRKMLYESWELKGFPGSLEFFSELKMLASTRVFWAIYLSIRPSCKVIIYDLKLRESVDIRFSGSFLAFVPHNTFRDNKMISTYFLYELCH